MSDYAYRPYRPCVGIMLYNDQGQIFAGQRLDNRAEAWQMPQGGIDEGETPEQACFREMAEEIGTDKAEISAVFPEWLDYDIPAPLANSLWNGKYRGQRQCWIALKFTGTDDDINIHTDEPEFKAWTWLSPDELIARAVPFKRDVYEKILGGFSEFLTQPQSHKKRVT